MQRTHTCQGLFSIGKLLSEIDLLVHQAPPGIMKKLATNVKQDQVRLDSFDAVL